MIALLSLLKNYCVLFLLFCLFWPGQLHEAKAAQASADTKGGVGAVATGPSLDELMVQASELRTFKKYQKAGEFYLKIHRDFPGTPEAADALWDFADLQKQIAEEETGEWEKVRDAYKRFISYYPDSGNAPDAYFEIGVALYFMRYQRESQSYFKLCIKRFPDDKLVVEAESWLLKIMIEVGRTDEAERKIEKLLKHNNAKIRLRAKIRMAELYNLKNDHQSSIKIFHELTGRNPEFYLDAPEALRIFGQTNLLAGNIKKGRDQLLYYLNLAEYLVDRADIFFDIGESYWREKKYQVAKKMYERAVEDGIDGLRPVVFSQMRIAQYLDDPLRVLGKWEKKQDLTDPKGDKPYLRVLDLFYDDPIAQDARGSLFVRFVARDDLEGMQDYGNNYLRIARLSEMGDTEKKKAGQILLAIAEKFHAEKKHQDLYELYFSEHQHAKDLPDGRFLYLVGQAMDALAMFDQASIIYYRALKWPLTEEDKIDLYFRRANVYLLMGDLEAAERLLKYLRKIYKGTKDIGEVMWNSGRLREAQKRPVNALEFYKKAVESVKSKEKKSKYALDMIRLLLEQDGAEAALSKVNNYKEKGWLYGFGLQQLYTKAGDRLRSKGQFIEALEAYGSALADNLPQEGKIVQSAHLYMGDCFVAVNEEEKGIAQYTKALEGDDELLKQMAQERLNQKDIERELSKLRATKVK